MPGDLTEITEIATALGMLSPDLASAVAQRPSELSNVPVSAWQRLVAAHSTGDHAASFATAFANGQAFLAAADGLRGRRPRIAEWKGPHRPPGDDVIPADLRIDRVYLVSCKYLSKVLLNPGPPRLFERLLIGEERSTANWFASTSPSEFQAFYAAAIAVLDLQELPATVGELNRHQQTLLKTGLSARTLPAALRAPWADLCRTVATESALRWSKAMTTPRDRLRLFWRLLRISTASYFVLGTDKAAHIRLRVDSAWDWMQYYELRALDIAPRIAGQPEVIWQATVRERLTNLDMNVDGHVEIRWSHGRFLGSPESKVYLDTPHSQVPGYNVLQ